MKRQLLLTGSLSFALLQSACLVSAETAAFYRYMEIADRARQAGDFNTALINYGRASRESWRNPEVSEGVNRLVEERLQRMESDHPDYVRYVRIANAAAFNGDTDTAIINFRRALAERPGDYYAGIRLQQVECIKSEDIQTLSHFESTCPSLFPNDSNQ